MRAVQGEVSEDVYVAQVRAQEELEDLFEALDRAKGQATGFLQKARPFLVPVDDSSSDTRTVWLAGMAVLGECEVESAEALAARRPAPCRTSCARR